MTGQISNSAFTPSVKTVQAQKGSRDAYEKMEEKGGWTDVVTDDLAAFIGEQDSFYLGTAAKDGQPYIQHRGGPKGFLKVIDDKTLAFADFLGNRQYIPSGNLAENHKAYLFLMDYPNRYRIKIWGTARIVDDDPELLARLADDGYRGKPEQAIVFTVKAWDRNCPQHITPRYTEVQVSDRVAEQVAGLQAEVQALKAERDAVAKALAEADR
jgi:predicted pyridoxine 5'-phosphate oxidase superfamily flavin-nucleotide-binding protein